MAIVDIETGREKYPHAALRHCEDPRHRASNRNKPVAVVETQHDVYAVCNDCMERIERSKEENNDGN